MGTSPRKTAAAAKRAEAPDPFAAQHELTPVAQATAAASDAARQAVATINTQLSAFDLVEADIPELERKFKGVAYNVDTPKGMREATEARLEIRKPRFAIEDARKAAKAPVLDLGRFIDARARKITERLLPLEAPIDGQIKAQETKEALRRADLQQRILDIERTPRQCIGKTSAQLQEVLDALEALPLADFQEFREPAAAAQHAAVASVRQLLAQAKDAEDAARLRAEQKAAQERRDTLQAKVDSIGDVLAFPYRTSQRVQQAVDRLSAFQIGEDFEEFAPAAREKKAQVLQALAARFNELAQAEKNAEEREAADRRAQQATMTYPNGAPMFGQQIKDNGDRVMLDDQGKRSVFCDIDEGDPPAPAPAVWDATAVQAMVLPMARDAWNTAFEDKTDGEPTDYALGRLPGMDAGGPAERRIEPPDFSVVDAEVPQRPSDTEILAVVADHYEVSCGQAATWLLTIDVTAALNQLPLQA